MKFLKSKAFIYLIFLILHFGLMNINVAEWGDSYRILRASEFIRDGEYPDNEKRQPLYSAFLALRPENVDQVVWGRGAMLVISLAVFFVFDKFISCYIKDLKYQKIGMIVFALTPVIFYWSLRIMADIFLLLFILLGFYQLKLKEKIFTRKDSVLLGIISGLAILTRFEGYLLFGSFGLGILYLDSEFNLKGFFMRVVKSAKLWIPYLISTLVIIVPFFLYRNPLLSSYFGEPSQRAYDLKMVWIYLISFLFVIGCIPIIFLIFRNLKNNYFILKSNIAVFSFLVLELILILLWPAAIPRLFISIVPILILLFLFSLKNLISTKITLKDYILVFLVFSFVAISQYILRLQFVVPKIPILVLVLGLQALSIFLLFFKKSINKFLVLTYISMGIVSIFTVLLHKDVFISVKSAAMYAARNLEGTIGYNDVSSVSNWYLNQAKTDKVNEGFYYNVGNRDLLLLEALRDFDPDYLLITNEHNTSMELNLSKRPYLEVLKEFRYNVNGTEFVTQIVSINKFYVEE